MTPAEALDRILDRATEDGAWSEPRGADELREVVRRDWAVRVLDAHGDDTGESLILRRRPNQSAVAHFRDAWNRSCRKEYEGASPVAARLAAAKAVWPELPESIRAEIGECP